MKMDSYDQSYNYIYSSRSIYLDYIQGHANDHTYK